MFVSLATEMIGVDSCAFLGLSSCEGWFLSAKPRDIDSVLYCHCIDGIFQTLHQKFLRFEPRLGHAPV